MPTLAPRPLAATYGYRTPTTPSGTWPQMTGLAWERTARIVAFISSLFISLWSFILNYFLAVVSKKIDWPPEISAKEGGVWRVWGRWAVDGKWGLKERKGKGFKESWDRRDERQEREGWAGEQDPSLHFWALTNVCIRSLLWLAWIEVCFPASQVSRPATSAVGSECPAPPSLSKSVTTDTAKNYESSLYILPNFHDLVSPALWPKALVCNAFKVLPGA